MVETVSSGALSPVLIELQVETDHSVAHATRTPVYRRIAHQLRAHIRNGVLPYGSRLPPSRDLAAQLGIARNCVIDAYDELIADGLLEGRGRRGTFVAGAVACTSDIAGEREANTKWLPAVLERVLADAHAHAVADAASVAVHAAAPDAAFPHAAVLSLSEPAYDWRPGQANARTLPIDAWRNACRAAGRHLPPQGYGDPRGDVGLRRAIVTWLRAHRSVVVDPEQIIVTQGTGLALRLIAQALVRPGDVCALEDPSYAGAALAFTRAGGALHHVQVDAHGVMVEHLAEATSTNKVQPVLLHVTPTHQYPTGGRLSGARRRALVELARSRAMLIIENEYDCEFHYAGTNHPPIFSNAPESTLLLNTFAKAVSPALRLGFIAAPLSVADALATCIERERVHVSWPVQKIVESLLVSGELDRHLRRVRRYYGGVRDTIRRRLAPYANVMQLSGDDGGLHMMLCARDDKADSALRAVLKARGVRFDEVSSFAAMRKDAKGLLFGYGHMTDMHLNEAIDVLERCVQKIADNA